MLAGMNVAAGPKLAAAVTNAGGLGVIGGVGYTPDMLREQIAELKGYLNDQNAPFGIDLLLPQVGGSARKTKYVLSLSASLPPQRHDTDRVQLRLHQGQAERARRYHHRFRCQAIRLRRRRPTQGCRREATQARHPIHEHDRTPQAHQEVPRYRC